MQCTFIALAPLATALLLLALQAPQSLDLRVGGAWVPWRAFAPGAPAAGDPLLARAIRWDDDRPGLRIGSFEVRPSGGFVSNRVAIVEVDPERFSFALAAAPRFAVRSADAWMEDSALVLAVNTGLFRKDGSPEGLVVLDGARHGALAGWLDALVAVEDGRVGLRDPGDARLLGPRASAFQVVPWLVRRGAVVLGAASGLRLSRTHRDRRLTLCVGSDGLVRFLLSNFEVFGESAGTIPLGLTLPEQATIAAAAGCADAVALDGGISAQLAVRARRLHRMPGWRDVPLYLVARER